MSSTKRGAARVANEMYPTPAWCVDRLLEHWRPQGGVLLEPCVGQGAIVNACVGAGVPNIWHAVELAGAPYLEHVRPAFFWGGQDFLTWTPPEDLRRARYAAVITNPPYSLAMDFLLRSMQFADEVAMLLRLNFLGSETRQPWLQFHAPDVYVLPNRPSFVVGHGRRKGSNDSCEYGWLVWQREVRRCGQTRILNLTPRSVRAAHREQIRACA